MLHAVNYLYFFVDDEAIVLVYAQNLLSGHGLSYSPSEGRLEGYTNLLHVFLSAGWLAGLKLAGISKLWVFAIGTLWSVLAGAGTVVLTSRLMSQVGATIAGYVAGLGFLVLAGPFAAWSVTPLETATATFVAVALVSLLAAAPGATRNRLVVATAITLILYRLDGFVFAGAAFAASFVFGDAERRAALLKTIVPATVAAGAVYWGWRYWYFGDIMSMPYYAKVAFKLAPAGTAIRKLPGTPYLLAFARLYWYAPLPLLLFGWLAFTRDRRLLFVAATLVLLASYVQMVGDWMFGFRFLVPLLPLAAVLSAATISQIDLRRPRAGAAVCALTLLVSGVAAVRLARTHDLDYQRSWYSTAPHTSPAPYFGRYYSVVEALRPHVRPGDRIAYSQAGLVAFELDLDNLDTLGLCSRFYAKLPTRDVIFTEVGRYTALTNKPALRAAEMYLLRHRPRYIIESAHLLRGANGAIPDEILAGRYRRAFTDAGGEAVFYEQAGAIDAPVDDPSRYFENLAHVANLRHASVDSVAIPAGSFQAELPFLYERTMTRDIERQYTALLTLPEQSRVSEIYIDRAQTSVAGRVEIALYDGTRQIFSHGEDTEATIPRRLYVKLPQAVGATRVMLTVTTRERGGMRLGDVRVLGQTPQLRDYVAAALSRSVTE